jgi:hypothetical protein
VAKIIVNDENGNMIAEFPEGTSDAVIKEVLARDFPKNQSKAPSADWMQNLKERDYLQQAPLTAQALKVAEGIPLVGGWIQDIAGAVSPELQAKTKAVSEAKQSQDPIESTALQVGGAVVPSIIAAPVVAPASFVNWLSKLPTVQKMVAVGGSGGLLGLVEGAVSGAGRGGEDGRMEGAVEGGSIGAAGGLFGGLLPPAVIKGYENLKVSFRNVGAEDIAKSLNISIPSAQVLSATFRDAGTDIKSALQNIFNAGEEGMLADSGFAAQALLDAAASTGGRASQITSEEVTGRAARQGAALSTSMDDALGVLPKVDDQAADALDMAENIASSTKVQRQEAYDLAYGTPIDFSSTAGREIERVFDALPDRFKGAAIERANEKMRLEAYKTGKPQPEQILADIADDGTVSFSTLPNLRQLDQIKQAIGEVGFKEVDNFGRPTADALDAVNWYREISNRLKEASPEYRKAVELGGDKISLDSALELGLGMLKPSMSVRDVVRGMKGSDAVEKQYAKLGVRSSIDDLISNVKATIASPDIDINTLRTVFTQLSSKNSRDKIKMLLSASEAKQLFKDLDQAQMSLALRAAVAMNSKTSIRITQKEIVDDMTDIGAFAHLLRLEPAKASQSVVQKVTGETDALGVAAKQEIYTDIARALTQIKGKEASNALKIIMRASKAEQVSDAELKAVSDLLLANSGFASIAAFSELGQSQVNGDQ